MQHDAGILLHTGLLAFDRRQTLLPLVHPLPRRSMRSGRGVEEDRVCLRHESLVMLIAQLQWHHGEDGSLLGLHHRLHIAWRDRLTLQFSANILLRFPRLCHEIHVLLVLLRAAPSLLEVLLRECGD